MHSISDLTTYCRKTTGDVPAKLVGASTTVVGTKMYLFGGRLVTERRMVSDLYVFDLEDFRWEKSVPSTEDDVPRARYFHSADAWNNQLVIFGGMSNKIDSANPEDLCVLNDVRFFDIASRRWLPSSFSNGVHSDPASDALVPRARYAHLSSVTADRLFIIGGQDYYNVWLDDVYVYDLLGKAWVQRRDYPRRCGTYRSVAVSANLHVRLPEEELRASQPSSSSTPPVPRFKPDNATSSSLELTPPDSLIRMPYSAPPTENYPCDIYLYSNYNFTDVKRELEVFSPLPDSDFTMHDRSLAMSGSSFPPGLRFPSGAVIGTHLIIAGTYLAHTYQAFSIWALDLLAMTWSRIDPGSAVATGSWCRGCLWAEKNSFLIFGNRNGHLVDDYNRRLLSWDHVAVVDLEAFGIYQPPPLELAIPRQQLGLSMLEEAVLTDFVIVCDDGRKISCSRKVLEERWSWFKEQLKQFGLKANNTLQSLPTSPTHIPLPSLPGIVVGQGPRHDPRLTPRIFYLSEPYPITLALLQYFYSLALITPLQHAAPVLSQLLILSSTYGIPRLEALAKHAMHRSLSNSTSVGVYEVATLCSCRSLQIRALKTVMSYSQRRPPGRSRQDRDDGSGGSRPPDPNGSGRSHTGGRSGSSGPTSRPRGTSDAAQSLVGGNNAIGSSRHFARNDIPSKDGLSDLPRGMPAHSKPFSGINFISSRFSFRRHPPLSVATDDAVTKLTPTNYRHKSDQQSEGPSTTPDHDSSPLSEDTVRILGTNLPLNPPLDSLPYPPQCPPSHSSSNCSESEPDDSDCPRTPISTSFPAFHLPRTFPRWTSSHIPANHDNSPVSINQFPPWVNSPTSQVSLLDSASIATLTASNDLEYGKTPRWSLSSELSSLSTLYDSRSAGHGVGPKVEVTLSDGHCDMLDLSVQHLSLGIPSSIASAINSPVDSPVTGQNLNRAAPFPRFLRPSGKRKETPKTRTGKKNLLKRRTALPITTTSGHKKALRLEAVKRKSLDVSAGS